MKIELSDGSKAPRTGPGTGKATAIPSLAVLYFENLSSDPDSDYFCAGITEDILTDLSKIKGLRVASRNAVARYRGESADIPRVANELGVTAVVEGSVRRAGDRVRITAQLINAADGFHIWAERYDRTLQDVFAVQEEIASSIVAALKVALAPGESEKLGSDRPGDVRAYDLYLKGRERYFNYTRESLHEALDLFQRATRVEPDYALAWAGIADCYGQMLQWDLGGHRVRDLTKLGLEAARRAIAIDPKLAEAHKAEALVLRGAGDMVASERALLQALKMNPRLISALINLGVAAYERCDIAGCERRMRRALESEPHQSFTTAWLNTVVRLTKRYDEGIALAQQGLASAVNEFERRGAYVALAATHLDRGDLAAARACMEELRRDEAMFLVAYLLDAVLLTRDGKAAHADRQLAIAETSAELNPTLVAWAIEVCIARGEMDRAVEFAKRTIFYDLCTTALRVTPELHPLLDLEPFAPRIARETLVWPSEAPPVPREIASLFTDVRMESGLPTSTGE